MASLSNSMWQTRKEHKSIHKQRRLYMIHRPKRLSVSGGVKESECDGLVREKLSF